MGIQQDAIGFTPTETNGSLTASAATIAANATRRGLIVGNPSDTVMTLRISSSAATAAIGIPVPAGTAISFRDGYVPTGAMSLFCAGTAKTYTLYEW
jgi:hypothetical protein